MPSTPFHPHGIFHDIDILQKICRSLMTRFHGGYFDRWDEEKQIKYLSGVLTPLIFGLILALEEDETNDQTDQQQRLRPYKP